MNQVVANTRITKSAIDALWREWSRTLQRWLVKKVKDPVLAEDLLQETFVRIMQGLPTVQHHERLSGWIFQLARRVVADHYRSLQKEERLHFNATPFLHETDSDVAEDVWLSEALGQYLRGVIDELPDKTREVMELVEMEGISQIEVSRRLGLSHSGVKSRVQRGRRKVKDIVASCCEISWDRYGTPLACSCQGEDCA